MSHEVFDGQLGLPALVMLREHAVDDHDVLGVDAGYRAMALVADLALARVELLERRESRRVAGRVLRERESGMSKQEREARARLFPRSGNVVPLPVRRDGGSAA